METIYEQPPLYDLILRGGHVIDPAGGHDGPLDVAIVDRRIAALAPDLSQAEARRMIDVSDQYVVPGLIDIHTHLYGYKASLTPDVHAFPYGVTTMVDAGGAGWKTFEDFRQTVIAHARARVLAYLNVVSVGMVDEVEQYLPAMDSAPTAEMIGRYPGILVGVKTAHYQGQSWEAVDRAVEAGRISGTPVMVDFRPRPGRTYKSLLLEHLRPGDIHTHMYAQHIPLLDAQGQVQAYVQEARRRGIRFDLGHGAGSFWWRIAVPAMEQGFWPDSIGTDLHIQSILRADAHLTTALSKMISLGMPLSEAIARATSIPADMVGRLDLGSLSPGAEADVAVLALKEGEFPYIDSGGARYVGTKQLSCVLTLRAGQVVWDPQGLTRRDWAEAGTYIFLD
jgi:dihydroorotase